MRRTIFILLALSSSAIAAEPKASVTAPASVAAGSRLWLDFTGSASDSPLYVQVDGPAPLSLTLLYPASGGTTPAFAYADPATAGKYRVIAVATGTPTGAKAPAIVAASCDVTVAAAPPPVPPTPPTPPPSPVPAAGTKLFAVAVYSADPTNADDLAFAAVRDDPTVVPSLAALNVVWHAWPSDDARLDTLKIRPFLPATLPAVLVYDAAGNVYTPDGMAQAKGGGAAFKPPLTTAGVVSLFKTMRGK